MIYVTIDVPDISPGAEAGSSIAVWSGAWDAAPAVGQTIQLRNDADGSTEFLRVAGVDWVVHTGDAQKLEWHDRRVNACIVNAVRYRP